VSVEDPVERCYREGWTDGLPVVPPTSERVAAMLAGRDPDEVVAVIEPAGNEATLRTVAANAVMAGCLPAYLPVIEAAVRAVAQPAFHLDRVQTTASSQVPMLLVGGPVVTEIGLDGGAEALGSSTRANATIGRALALVLRNVGSLDGLPHATIGHAGRYSYCFAENQDLTPWPSWHTSKGFDAGTSYATVYPGEAPLVVTDMGHLEPQDILHTIARAIAIPGTYNAYFRQDLWLVMSPQHAEALHAAGWSREDAVAFLHEHASLPPSRLRGRGLYGYLDDLLPPTWLDGLADDDPVPLVDRPERINIAVAGGAFGGYTAVVFGEGETVTEAVVACAEVAV
jgi:hypothetical protein